MHLFMIKDFPKFCKACQVLSFISQIADRLIDLTRFIVVENEKISIVGHVLSPFVADDKGANAGIPPPRNYRRSWTIQVTCSRFLPFLVQIAHPFHKIDFDHFQKSYHFHGIETLCVLMFSAIKHFISN